MQQSVAWSNVYCRPGVFRVGQKVRTHRFVFYKPCMYCFPGPRTILSLKIVRKVVKSLKQNVQCARHDLQSRVPDDDSIDHQQLHE